jgi:DNA-directed RNA polymerase specialized sigma24 family protein
VCTWENAPHASFFLPAAHLQPLPPERGDVIVSAEDQVLPGVEFVDLARALARLFPELRAVVQATVLDGLSTKESYWISRRVEPVFAAGDSFI